MLLVRLARKQKVGRPSPAARAVEEVWIATPPYSAAQPAWHGTIGPQDADGEIERRLEITAEGIRLFEVAPRISRCDGQTARIGARRLDVASGRFVPEPPPSSPGTALSARLAARSPARPRIGFPFQSSTMPPADATALEARQLVAPLALSDGDLESVWRERGDGEPAGVLTARASGGGFAITRIELVPGDVRSEALFRASARVKSFALVLGPSAAERFDVTLPVLPATAAAARAYPLVVELPRPIPSACLSIIPRELVPGKERNGVAWSEIAIFTDLDGAQGPTRLVAELEQPGCEGRVEDVAALGPRVLVPLAEALSKGGGPTTTSCRLEAMARITERSPPNAEASVRLAKHLSAWFAADAMASDDEQRLGRVLARLTPSPTAALATIVADAAVSTRARLRGARALAALPGPQAERALVEQVGHGDAELRTELRRLVVTRAGIDGVAPLLEALAATPAGGDARRADLAFAIGAAVAQRAKNDRGNQDPGNQDRENQERARAAAALVALVEDKDNEFRVRARAVEALGGVGEPGLSSLLKVLEHEEPPLRLLAALALVSGSMPVARVVAPLRRALADSDPAVREAAVLALAKVRDNEATALIVAGAKQEPWPRVRRAEIEALGQLCGAAAGDLLLRAAERDVTDLRRLALAGLLRCRDPRLPDLLIKLLGDESQPPTVRSQAATLAARIGDRRLAPALAEILPRLVEQSNADLALEETAITTLSALARLGGPSLEDGALLVSADSRPQLRRAGMTALGQACEGERARATLRGAVKDSDESVATAARASLRRCERGATGSPPAPMPSSSRNLP